VAEIVLTGGLVLVVAAGIGAVTLFSGADNHNDPSAGAADTAPTSPNPTIESPAPATIGPSLTASGSASSADQSTTNPPTGGCAFTVTEGVCPSAPPIAAAAGKHWRVSYSAEFSGTAYDKAKVTPCFDWNYGDCTSTFNNGREHYQPSQVVVSDGTAKLVAAPLNPPYSSSACQNSSCTYKAGLLSTARPNANGSNYLYSFTYGYVESRFRFPATQGFFTAFWMLPTNPSYTYRSEIDILELLGDDPTTMFMTYHYNNRSQSFAVNRGKFNNGACGVTDYSTQFVRMGVDWEPDHIAWYINGTECARFTNASQIESGPMQIILHMMVDNDWQRQWNVGLADPTLTRQLEVDYLRVYQQTA
jgi:beta-glucanase (GH16 family)